MIYKTPAKKWLYGLPIGNGRIAGMLMEDEEKDFLSLNHEQLWGYGDNNRRAEDNGKYLPFVRSLFYDGKYFEAAYVTNALYSGRNNQKNTKTQMLNKYAMACDVIFSYICKENEFAQRRLNLIDGVASIVRKIDGATVKSEYFASVSSDKFFFSWKSDKKFSGKLWLERKPEEDITNPVRVDDENCILSPLKVDEKTIVLDGILKDNIKFSNMLSYKTDGNIKTSSDGVEIIDATYIYVVLNISVRDEKVDASMPSDWDSEREAHTSKFGELMNRIDFKLEEDESLKSLPTDERVEKMKETGYDNGINMLYFHFGRYLMLSGTLLGKLPTNLQGKWNNFIYPPWSSDYHLDINLQMNYWATEKIDMPEAMESFISYILKMQEPGKDSAKRLYNCRGILLPLSSDANGEYVGSYSWTAWIGAAAWLGQHLWWHYTYTGDKKYLARVYDHFKQTALFYEDYMEKDKNGVYQICPSYSPENPLVGQGNAPVGLSISCAMDVQLAYDALGYAIEASKILGVDEDETVKWQEMRDNLPPFKIGSDGRLMEWNEEFEEYDPGHRHLSHLYGAYPSELFTPEKRKEQFEATKKSLEYRLSFGGGYTGWSRSWCACLYARYGQGEDFFEHYNSLIKDYAAATLLDLHPQLDTFIFQIDGNYGAVAALVEAIVGYYDNKAHILSALPKRWSKGNLCGIKIPGGHSVNVWWEDGKLSKLSVVIGFEEKAVLVYDGKEYIASGKKGEQIDIAI